MKDLNTAFKTLAAMLFCALMPGLCSAQNQDVAYPHVAVMTPEAASLASYTDVPVSHYTGVPEISIPLYTIQDGDFELPLTLRYHASGIQAAQEATWVGLGWSLDVGGTVSRTVNGTDDFLERGWDRSYPWVRKGWYDAPAYNGDWRTLYDTVAVSGSAPMGNLRLHQIYDAEPDIFFYALPGLSGKFLLEKGGGAVLFNRSHNVKVEVVRPKGRQAVHLTLYDSKGNKYFFEKEVVSLNYTASGPLYKNTITASLHTITYPMGGTSAFYYENNDIGQTFSSITNNDEGGGKQNAAASSGNTCRQAFLAVYHNAVANEHPDLPECDTLAFKVASTTASPTYGAGLRIASIETDTIVRTFKYSQGTVMRPPTLYYFGKRAGYTEADAEALVQVSESKTPLSTFSQGNAVGYDWVEESVCTYGDTITTRHEFLNEAETEQYDDSFPDAPFLAVYTNGLPSAVGNGQNGKTLREETCTYKPVRRSRIWALRDRSQQGWDSDRLSYYYDIEWPQLREKTETVHEQNGDYVQRMAYSYNDNHLLRSATTVIDSTTVEWRTLYPSDLTGSVYRQMADSNALAIPVEVMTLKDGKVATARRVEYADSLGLFLPKTLLQTEGTTLLDSASYASTYSARMHFDGYDAKGRLLQMRQGASTLTYEWDERSWQPSAITQDGLTTRYTHAPLLGVTSITPPNGNTVHYTYDGLGRLTSKADLDSCLQAAYSYYYYSNTLPKNYIRAYAYHSATQQTSSILITYYDCLGRNTQIATNGLGDNGNWAFAPQNHDALGRVKNKWMFSEVQYGTTYNFTRYHYDALGRSTREETPGKDWKKSNKSVLHSYTVNASNTVRRYRAPLGVNSLQKAGYYAKGELHGETITDEDGGQLTTFTDRYGQKVLERRRGTDGLQADTYYIYNDLGQLRYVLSPQYQKERRLSMPMSTATMSAATWPRRFCLDASPCSTGTTRPTDLPTSRMVS